MKDKTQNTKSSFFSGSNGIAWGGAIDMANIGLSTLFNFSQAKRQAKALMKQTKNNVEYKGDQVRSLMSNQALTYLKNGVGMSGSVLDVINTTGKEGMKEISNMLSYTTSQIKDSYRQLRNQTISNVISSGIRTGTNIYAYNNS